MLTDEERRERKRESQRRYMTAHREELNAYRLQYYHKRRAAMTEEEKQALRDQKREYNRLMKQKSRARKKTAKKGL